MHRGMGLLVALIVGAMALPSEGSAQFRPWQISIAGGPSFPRGELADEADTGYHVQGSIGVDFPLLPIGVRADALWQEYPDVHDDWVRQLGALANVTVGMPMLLIQPYALVGAGLIRTKLGEEHGGETDTNAGFNAGVGLDFGFLGLGGFVEARFLNLLGGGEAKNRQGIPISAGIRF